MIVPIVGDKVAVLPEVRGRNFVVSKPTIRYDLELHFLPRPSQPLSTIPLLKDLTDIISMEMVEM